MDINFQNLNDFHQTLSTAFFDALAAAPPAEWSRIAMRMGSSSSRNTYPFLGETSSMREWLGSRIATQMESFRYSIENRKFEKTMTALRDELMDDATGLISVYGSRAAAMARAVAVHPDELVMATLASGNSLACFDGQNFFDTDHVHGVRDNSTGIVTQTTVSNDMGGSSPSWYLFDTSKAIMPLIYQVREAPVFNAMLDLNSYHVFNTHEFTWGAFCRDAAGFGLWQSAVKSSQPITEANYLAARIRMQSFNNYEGRNMGMNPTLLVTPRGSIQDDAKKLFTLDYLSVTGGSTQNNYLKGAVDLMVSNYLPVS